VAPTATPDVDHSVSLSSELNAQPAVIKTQESRDEKLRIQVIRVQIRLNTLGLYNDKIDGVFGSTTKNALRIFQRVREIPATGLMTTDTLNALGIPAVN
jgi:His-Xaa-Ser repeat protein HxsA